ncbi:FecR family protein [Chryseobacterium gwangjuense]|uniref:FecR family protein n=1 Tax=Chryseobacterium gwangjuense TaxID=1069980 RepID=UPI001E620D34|nr:FecR family protein [Chryseobacterium gwangjuense]MCE3074163.1 FecR family protein [Chryseobacterium gwangjuense]
MGTQHFDLFSAEERKKQCEIIKQKIITKERKKRQQISLVGVCAVLLLSISLCGVYSSFLASKTYTAHVAEKFVQLQDNTTITLSKGSELIVEQSLFSNTRNVYLKGTAVFKVSKSKEHPFIVHGKDYEATVHGTAFKIIQTNSSFQVDLYEGSVSVNQRKKQEAYRLKPGQTFSNFGQKETAVILTDPHPKDKNHKSLADSKSLVEAEFMDAPIMEAVDVIGKITGKKIELPTEFQHTHILIDLKGDNAEIILKKLAAYLKLELHENKNSYELRK